MKPYQLAVIVMLVLFCSFLKADTAFDGIWRGSSLCQVKNSPCHDETVVYHISKSADHQTYQVLMNKIVDGKEEEMGTMNFVYDAGKQSYVSKDTVRNAEWVFKIKDSKLEGTLVYRGQLYRIINAVKQP